ncbi:MAG: hypothetical protein ACRDT9_01080 [Agromyces sp.]
MKECPEELIRLQEHRAALFREGTSTWAARCEADDDPTSVAFLSQRLRRSVERYRRDPLNAQISFDCRRRDAHGRGRGGYLLLVRGRTRDGARPDVEFAGFVALGQERYDVLSKCYEATGLPLETSVSIDGPGTVSAGASTQEAAIATFVCESTHPAPVFAPLTEEELGWVFDYLTEFLAPSYAANGIGSPAPPDRADFVAAWPQQGWFPSPDERFDDDEMHRALREACPLPE